MVAAGIRRRWIGPGNCRHNIAGNPLAVPASPKSQAACRVMNIRHLRQRHCFDTGNEVFLPVTLLCRSRFTMSVRILLLLMMIVTLAGRSEANCFPMASEPVTQSEMMQDCTDMESGPVGSQQPEPLHHSDGCTVGDVPSGLSCSANGSRSPIIATRGYCHRAMFLRLSRCWSE